MKDRLEMLEELQEELEILDEMIYDAVLRSEELFAEDYRIGSIVSKVFLRLEEAREETQIALSEVLMEIEQMDY